MAFIGIFCTACYSNHPENTGVNACPVYQSRHWQAWLNHYDGPGGKYRLQIVGEIDLPSPAYDVMFQWGITDRALPPGQQIELHIFAREDVIAPRVITSLPVSFTHQVNFPPSERFLFIAAINYW